MPLATASSLPRIALVGTGGTIAGAGVAEAGAPSAAYRAAVVSAADLVAAVPGLGLLAELHAEQLLQIDSVDFTDALLLRLARRVAELCARDDVDGVVITHGTDTMTETAKVLAAQVPGKTMVLTGALSPARFAETDAPFNLGMAVAAVQTAPPGVWIAMSGQVFDGLKVRKDREAGKFVAI